MRDILWRAALGAALSTMAGTGAALAFGSGGSSGEGDGHLRQQLQNPGYIEPSPYAYRRNDRGAEYGAYRRGYPIYGEWGRKYR